MIAFVVCDNIVHQTTMQRTQQYCKYTCCRHELLIISPSLYTAVKREKKEKNERQRKTSKSPIPNNYIAINAEILYLFASHLYSCIQCTLTQLTGQCPFIPLDFDFRTIFQNSLITMITINITQFTTTEHIMHALLYSGDNRRQKANEAKSQENFPTSFFARLLTFRFDRLQIFVILSLSYKNYNRQHSVLSSFEIA